MILSMLMRFLRSWRDNFLKGYNVRITRQARDHFRGMKKYIEEELLSPDAARNITGTLKKKIKNLSRMPERVKLTDSEQPYP